MVCIRYTYPLRADVQEPLCSGNPSRCRHGAKAREGDAWEMLIESQATDGYIDFVQFRALCRDILGLDERESHLRAVFAQLDYERCGDVAIDDVIEFMRSDAGRRIAAAIAADDDGVESVASSGGATQPPGETASCAFAKSEAAGTVERMRSRLKGAAYTLGGQEWQRLLRDHDTEEEGWLDWSPRARMRMRGCARAPEGRLKRPERGSSSWGGPSFQNERVLCVCAHRASRLQSDRRGVSLSSVGLLADAISMVNLVPAHHKAALTHLRPHEARIRTSIGAFVIVHVRPFSESPETESSPGWLSRSRDMSQRTQRRRAIRGWCKEAASRERGSRMPVVLVQTSCRSAALEQTVGS